MAIKIEAQLRVSSDGIDIKLLDDMSEDITETELHLLNKLKPAFRNFIMAELELNDIFVTAVHKDLAITTTSH